MSLPPLPPTPGAPSSGAPSSGAPSSGAPSTSGAQCWNCHQVVQAGSVSCIWCGAIQQVSPAQFLVAPALAGAGAVGADAGGSAPMGIPPQGFPQPATPHQMSVRPNVQRPPRGTATLDPVFAGTVASTGARLGAFTADVIAVALVALVVTLATSSIVYGLIALAEALVIMWVLEARTGLTPGNALFRLRTARHDAPYSPGVGRSFVRWLITGAGFMVAAVGAWIVVASSAWDDAGKGRTWADRAALTVVVAVPPRTPRKAAFPRDIGNMQQQGMAVTMGSQPEALPPGAAMHYLTPPVPSLVPHVISTTARFSVVDEDSLSTSNTAAGGQTFIASPVPIIEEPSSGLVAGIIPASGAEAPSASGTLLLIFDTGQREQFAAPVSVNLGRNPVATEPSDKLVVVTDPDSTVSKTHLRLEHSRGRTWLTDGDSTNGTELLSEDGDSVVLVPGERVLLDDGVRVRIGDRTFTVSILLGSEKA